MSVDWTTGAQWAHRLIRWLQQQGHTPTIWLRDYFLDKTTTPVLIAQLRAQAREHGLVLQRIVVNGHELWRADARTDLEGTR